MILEGLVTTLDTKRRLNVAPMGPIVEPDIGLLVLRPFQTSTTYRNLKATGRGVFHITDDSLMIAQGAIGRLDEFIDTFPAEKIDALVLRSACRWYEFEVESLDDSRERTMILARVVHRGTLRDFVGFHRARHAVLEAAILATRRHLIPPEEITRQFAALKVIVEKTAGVDERQAFQMLEEFLATGDESSSPAPQSRAAPLTTSVIQTGCRLHFGPFSVGGNGPREFGGVGLMLQSPGVTLSVQKLPDAVPDCLTDCPPESREAIQFALHCFRESAPFPHPVGPVAVTLYQSIGRHAGLGSGTQIALAVARGLASLFGPTSLDSTALARRAGRGLRSAIGIHGFQSGGFLLDAGKSSAEAPGVLAARAAFPNWGILLATPTEAAGLSGSAERRAFASLPPMPSTQTDRLARIALLELLPAVIEHDFPAASASLRAFGQLVGSYFAPVQGGVFAHPLMRELDEELERRNIPGVAQSSWGPTVAILQPSLAEAQSLANELSASPQWSHCRFQATTARNSGASTQVIST